MSPTNSLPLRAARLARLPARRSASSTSPPARATCASVSSTAAIQRSSPVSSIWRRASAGQLPGALDLAGGQVGQGEVVLDAGRLEDRPRGAVEGHALRAGANGGLEVADLAVADGQVEQERGATAIVEVGGESACLLEVGERACRLAGA